MLTLNSNVLKIGNKWLLPVQSGGVVPPTPTVYQVTTSATHGTVTASPTEGTTGTEVTLSNTPDTHYHFGSYSITGATLKNANQFDIADSDVSVVGNFIEDTKYNVTVNQSTGGTISASPTTGYTGTEVTLSNTPATHYSFGSYNLTGATLKSANKFDIGTSNVTVGATWIEDTKYTVTCTNDGHGTIAASPTSNYSGSTVTLSNTPNSGYDFDKYTLVSGTGASISGNILTIGTSNVTVRGDFVAQAASGYKYFVLKLTGFETSISDQQPYDVCTFKYNNSAPTSTNFRGVGYCNSTYNPDLIQLNPTSQVLSMLVTTTPAQSPYALAVTRSDISSLSDKALYIAVGTDTEASSCSLSWKDFLETMTSSASCTINATLYGTNTISGNNYIHKNDLTQLAQVSHSCGYYWPYSGYGYGSMSTGTISWTA